QIIQPAFSIFLPVIDLSQLADAAYEAEALRLGLEETYKPFVLSQAPLIRGLLLRIKENEHIVLLTMHHIVSDGWSIGVLIRELTALYEAHSSNRPSPLPELPIQYADFAVWQRQWLQGEALESQLSYWRRMLENAPPALELPKDRPRSAIQTFQ